MNEEWVKKYFKAFDRNHRQVKLRKNFVWLVCFEYCLFVRC